MFSIKKKAKLYEFEGYVTDSLKKEMQQYYPKADAIRRDADTNDIHMDKKSFQVNFVKMFPEGRIFLNLMQLRLAVKEFFKHWNLLSKASSKFIRCSYSHTPGTRKKPDDNLDEGDESKGRKRPSTASLINCPFMVKWSLLDHKAPHRNDIFYRVKVSTIECTEHTCMMSQIN